MRFSVLSSGSKANSTFLECGEERLLIDIGLSCRQTEQRLRSIGIAPESITGILLTHEHRDHIIGIPGFSRKYKVPVYASFETAQFLQDVWCIENFKAGNSFDLRSTRISPFSISHDAVDPVGFRIESEGLAFAMLTDLGVVTEQIKQALIGVNAIVLEANHDPEMLETCRYPWVLKQRIASTHGHLSNEDAGALLKDIMHSELMHVVLGHISENSNTPKIAAKTVAAKQDLLPAEFTCACVKQATELYRVGVEQQSLRLAI